MDFGELNLTIIGEWFCEQLALSQRSDKYEILRFWYISHYKLFDIEEFKSEVRAAYVASGKEIYNILQKPYLDSIRYMEYHDFALADMWNACMAGETYQGKEITLGNAYYEITKEKKILRRSYADIEFFETKWESKIMVTNFPLYDYCYGVQMFLITEYPQYFIYDNFPQRLNLIRNSDRFRNDTLSDFDFIMSNIAAHKFKREMLSARQLYKEIKAFKKWPFEEFMQRIDKYTQSKWLYSKLIKYRGKDVLGYKINMGIGQTHVVNNQDYYKKKKSPASEVLKWASGSSWKLLVFIATIGGILSGIWYFIDLYVRFVKKG